MPTLLVRHADASFTAPLAASTLVGRGWPCVVRLRDASVPLYWVELRWSAGWTWRALGAEERTQSLHHNAPRSHVVRRRRRRRRRRREVGRVGRKEVIHGPLQPLAAAAAAAGRGE